jgi:hypothetical protein
MTVNLIWVSACRIRIVISGEFMGRIWLWWDERQHSWLCVKSQKYGSKLYLKISRHSNDSAEGAEYDSQGQARSASPLVNETKLALQP